MVIAPHPVQYCGCRLEVGRLEGWKVGSWKVGGWKVWRLEGFGAWMLKVGARAPELLPLGWLDVEG